MASEKIIKLTLLCGFICGSIFFVGGEKIGILIYKSLDVGILIKFLSPIVPLMYLDSICDGICAGVFPCPDGGLSPQPLYAGADPPAEKRAFPCRHRHGTVRQRFFGKRGS